MSIAYFKIVYFEARASQIEVNLFFYITWLVKEKLIKNPL